MPVMVFARFVNPIQLLDLMRYADTTSACAIIGRE